HLYYALTLHDTDSSDIRHAIRHAYILVLFFFSSRRRHTRSKGDWSSDVCSSDLNDNGHDVLMYGRNGEVVSEIGQRHTNQRFLKNIDLNEGILATNDLKEAAAHAELIVLAVPVKAIRTVSSELDGILSELGKKTIIVHVAKGLELGTHMRVSDVIAEEMT